LLSLTAQQQAMALGPPKELEKIKQRATKADQAMLTANQQYQEAVAQLEESRVLWEKEMVGARCGRLVSRNAGLCHVSF
jgi:hypothetical protein